MRPVAGPNEPGWDAIRSPGDAVDRRDGRSAASTKVDHLVEPQLRALDASAHLARRRRVHNTDQPLLSLVDWLTFVPGRASRPGCFGVTGKARSTRPSRSEHVARPVWLQRYLQGQSRVRK